MTPSLGEMSVRIETMARERQLRAWDPEWYGWRFEIPLSWYAMLDKGDFRAVLLAPPDRFWVFGYPACVDATLRDDEIRLVQL